jgi:hypothetical protein
VKNGVLATKHGIEHVKDTVVDVAHSGLEAVKHAGEKVMDVAKVTIHTKHEIVSDAAHAGIGMAKAIGEKAVDVVTAPIRLAKSVMHHAHDKVEEIHENVHHHHA